MLHLISVSLPTDEIMQQEIRPLLSVDIIEQLHRQFALLSGMKQDFTALPVLHWHRDFGGQRLNFQVTVTVILNAIAHAGP